MGGGKGGDQEVMIPGPKRMDSVLGREAGAPPIIGHGETLGQDWVMDSGAAACRFQRYEKGVCTENGASLTHVLCHRLVLSASPRGSCRDTLEVPEIPYKPESNPKNGAHILYLTEEM